MNNTNPHKRGTIGYEAYAKANPSQSPRINWGKQYNIDKALFFVLKLLVVGVFLGYLNNLTKTPETPTQAPTMTTAKPADYLADFVASRIIGGVLVGTPHRCKDSAGSTRDVWAVVIQGHNAYGATIQQGAVVATINGVRQLIKDTDADYQNNVGLCR